MSWTELKDATRSLQAYYEYLMGTRLDTGIPTSEQVKGMPADNLMQQDVFANLTDVAPFPVDRRDIGRANPWMDNPYMISQYTTISRDAAPFQHNERNWRAGNWATILNGSPTHPVVDLVDGPRGVWMPVAPKLVDPGFVGSGTYTPGPLYPAVGRLVNF